MEPNDTPPDTTAPAAAAPTDQPTTPPAASAKTFTQEEVNRIAASAREEGKRSAQKQMPAPKPADPPKPAPAATTSETPSLADMERIVETRVAAESALVTFFVTNQVAPEKQAIVRRQFAAAKPTDVSAWLESDVSPLLGKSPAPPAVQPAATAAPAATPATEAPKPAAAPAAPSAHTLPTANGVVDLFNLKPEELQALGPAGVRANLEKLWAIGNQMSGAPTRPKPPSQR